MKSYHGQRLSTVPGDVHVVVEVNWGYCTNCKDIFPERSEEGFSHFDKNYQLCKSTVEDVHPIREDLKKRNIKEPSDFEWGPDHTNGPDNLALSILWDVTGERPNTSDVRALSNDVIRKLNRDRWSLDEYDIKRFLIQRDGRYVLA